jgi:hypothetical protein
MKQEFLDCYLNTDKKPTYKQVSEELTTKLNKIISIEKIKELYDEEIETLKDIQKLRLLHNSIEKRSGKNYNFQGFKDFYIWYQNTDKHCCYCGVAESTIENVWKNNWRTKRNRGRSLEVERVDSISNLYNSSNCKLACYFCNNHKSDLIAKEHYDKYFAIPMKNYLEEISQIKNPNPHKII